MKKSVIKYEVAKTLHPVAVDANWNKEVWRPIKSFTIENTNGWEMSFTPKVEVKLCYNNNNLYVIYKVKDKYVLASERKINGMVWQDSCVEFFFSPFDRVGPYFNLEINAIGTPLMSYQIIPHVEYSRLTASVISQIGIAHSLEEFIELESEDSIEWYLELAIPFSILNNYPNFIIPKSGTRWKANFYKCAEKNSHPYWLSWAPINSIKPDFHLPQFFGELEFM